jgi:cytochrome d ubiquinol oxidase subunit II
MKKNVGGIDRALRIVAGLTLIALAAIFYGVVVVFPVIIGYTAYAYRVYWGKSTVLVY